MFARLETILQGQRELVGSDLEADAHSRSARA
jgi:hypothetical protein